MFGTVKTVCCRKCHRKVQVFVGDVRPCMVTCPRCLTRWPYMGGVKEWQIQPKGK